MSPVVTLAARPRSPSERPTAQRLRALLRESRGATKAMEARGEQADKLDALAAKMDTANAGVCVGGGGVGAAAAAGGAPHEPE